MPENIILVNEIFIILMPLLQKLFDWSGILDNALNKIRTEGDFLNLMKNIYKKLADNITPNDERLNAFQDREQGKNVYSFQFCLTLYWMS